MFGGTARAAIMTMINGIGFAPLAVVVGLCMMGASMNSKKDELVWEYEDVINEMADKIAKEFVVQQTLQNIVKINKCFSNLIAEQEILNHFIDEDTM